MQLKFKILFAALAASFAFATEAKATDLIIRPDTTLAFARRDTCELLLDYYRPAEGSVTTIDGKAKPTIVWMFGGGFFSGERNNDYDLGWFKEMTEAGYGIVSIDYRLGLKGFKGAGLNKKFIDATEHAIKIAVEDLYEATLYLIRAGKELGIDPDNLVAAGCSAGAISVQQAELWICNRAETATMLPEGFNYKGVMPFAGSIFSKDGRIRYHKEPCPIAMFHGTSDTTVPYKQIKFFRLIMAGSDHLARIYKKNGWSYCIYRFKDHGHEISSGNRFFVDIETRFLEENVIKGNMRIEDALIDDPSFPHPEWGNKDFTKLYE